MAIARTNILAGGREIGPGAELPETVTFNGRERQVDIDGLIAAGRACDPAVCSLPVGECCGRRPVPTPEPTPPAPVVVPAPAPAPEPEPAPAIEPAPAPESAAASTARRNARTRNAG